MSSARMSSATTTTIPRPLYLAAVAALFAAVVFLAGPASANDRRGRDESSYAFSFGTEVANLTFVVHDDHRRSRRSHHYDERNHHRSHRNDHHRRHRRDGHSFLRFLSHQVRHDVAHARRHHEPVLFRSHDHRRHHGQPCTEIHVVVDGRDRHHTASRHGNDHSEHRGRGRTARYDY